MGRAKRLRKEMRDKGIKHKPFVFILKPSSLFEWKKLSQDFVEWCKKDTSRNVNQFAIERGYPPRKLKNWTAENELWADCYNYGRYLIGIRLEELAFDYKINTSMVKQRLPLLDDEMREFMESGKDTGKTSSGTIVYREVEMPRIESSPLVPELKKDDSESAL
jgi:hypothetical protein